MRFFTLRLSVLLTTSCLLYHIPAMSQTTHAQACAPVMLSALIAAHNEPAGEVHVALSNIVGHNLPGKVVLRASAGGKAYQVNAPEGVALAACPPGDYTAYMYVYEMGVPILVEVRDTRIEPGEMASLLLTLTEGSGHRPLMSFDTDGDLVLDRVEEELGTDRFDPACIPGVERIPMHNKVLKEEAGWYRGELHARSSYGGGTESVRELVRRAERSRLDFLAITDRNTMAACYDPDFQSDSVVLIPAMEWGDSKRGFGLVYGPQTVPEPADTFAHAQAIARRVQLQGGIFAIAHPCFRDAPWQWGLEFVNAIEVWCRDWRSMPPVTLSDLDEDLQVRGEPRLARNPRTGLKMPGHHIDGELLYPIAQAAATENLAANAKAEIFWDAHLNNGLRVSPIAGSLSSSSKVPLGRPITYVYAHEKSLEGILLGLRQGRTFVSSGPDGPTIDLYANVNIDGRTVYVPMGGIIPIGMEAQLVVSVRNGRGKKVQVYADGRPIISRTMDSNTYDRRITVEPDSYRVYRARVIEQADIDPRQALAEIGRGMTTVLALSSPIYAEHLALSPPARPEAAEPVPDLESLPVEKRVQMAMEAVERIAKGEKHEGWVSIEPNGLPPVYATGVRSQDGRVYISTDASRPPQFFFDASDDEFRPPAGAEVREIRPTVIY